MARRVILPLLCVAMAAVAAGIGPAPAVVVRANYMHMDYRCPSCMRLEKWSSIAIRQGLADSMRTGRLEWSTQSMETPEGAALADRIGLATKALVLMEMRDGRMVRFKELKDTWKNLRDSTAFAAYVKTETIAFLRAAR